MNNLLFDEFTTSNNNKIIITFIKHASLIINFDNKIIYIDPVSEYADFSKLQKADIILITHEHYDHFDKKAIEDLKKENTKIILNKNSKELLGSGDYMLNGDNLKISDNILVEAVPAYNTTKNHLQYHPKGRDNGYILTLDNIRIYIAGDTEDIDEMKKIKNIDILFLPVNQPYTMLPEQAANIAKIIKPKVFYPYHYSDTKIEKVVDLLKNNKEIDVRIRNMQ